MKEHLRGKQYESEHDMNTAVTAYLHRLSKDEYKAATDRLPRRWKKYVDSAGDYTDYRKHVQTFRNISSVVNLYFVTIKSCTKLLIWPTANGFPKGLQHEPAGFVIETQS